MKTKSKHEIEMTNMVYLVLSYPKISGCIWFFTQFTSHFSTTARCSLFQVATHFVAPNVAFHD